MPTQQPWPIARALGRVVVTVSDELGKESAERLQALLHDLIDGQGNLEVEVDVMQVSAIDPTAVEALVDATQQMTSRGGTLVISAARPEVAQHLSRHQLVLSPPLEESPAPSQPRAMVDLRESSTVSGAAASGADAVVRRLFEVGLVLRLASGNAAEHDANRLSAILEQVDAIIHDLERGALDALIARSRLPRSSAVSPSVPARIQEVAAAIEQLRIGDCVGLEERDAMRAWLAEAARALESAPAERPAR